MFSHDDKDSLSLGQKLDVPKKKEDAGAVSAMAKFRTMDKRAQSADESGSGSGVNTTHQNAIKCEIHLHVPLSFSLFTLGELGKGCGQTYSFLLIEFNHWVHVKGR